ncbi:MAG TPA: tetratricopeptide repeat protein [Pyrinomonadaceae bacterium]|nr:tetratricopeptide repeat protein [Pyrinomonadaceae bacterium]
MKRVTLSLAFLLFLSAVIPAPVVAKDDWVSVRTRNFLLVGNATEKQIRQVGIRLEQFRAAIARLFGKAIFDSHTPTTVIIFKNHESYRPFKAKPNTAGYFQWNPHINYITLTTEVRGDQNPYNVVFHEYTHLLLNSINADMPLWFDEGLAEYYSTLDISGDLQVVLGKPIATHVSQLRQNQMLPLKQLFQVDRQSPYYNESDKQSVFYAQSWALMHYLIAGNEGHLKTQLGKFVDLMAANVPMEQAFQQSFAMSFENMENELRVYVRRDRYPTVSGVFESKLGFDVGIKTARLSQAEAQAYLGDLMLQGDRIEAEHYIQSALVLDPNLAMAHASLALLRARQGKSQEARARMEQAVTADPENYLLHYYYAFVLSRPGIADRDMVLGFTSETIAKMRDELKKAIELKPDFRESYNLMAFINLASGRQLDEAAKILHESLAISPGRNDLLLTLAQVHMRQEDYDAARQALKKVKQNNSDVQIRGRVDAMLRQITSVEEILTRIREGKEVGSGEAGSVATQNDQATNPEAVQDIDPSIYLRAALRKPQNGEMQIQGTLVRIDCDEKGFMLLVRVGERVMSLRTMGFKNLNFRSFSADAGREITCGPRMAGNNVVVTYVRPAELLTQIAGVMKSIEFVPSDFKLNPDQ